MLRASHRMMGGAVAALGLALLAGAALAETVTLKLKSGGLEIEGDLVAFDGSMYQLKSPVFGDMTLDAARFSCSGAGCPSEKTSAGAAKLSASKALAAAPVAAAGGADIALSGSNTIGSALMPALVEAFAQANGLSSTKVVAASGNPLEIEFKLADKSSKPVATVRLRRHGSSTAFEDLEKGANDIGMSSRRIKDAEIKTLGDKGLGDMISPDHEHVLGLDGLILTVAQNNPATTIAQDNIAKIFSGQIKDWSELGLPAGKIHVYAPSDKNGTFSTFEDLVLKPAKVKLTADAKRTENHAEQADWVAADPLGIGFVGVAYQRNTRALGIELTCGMKATATRFSMKTEEYPLSRRLYLYTPGAPRVALANSLLDFALSSQAQPVMVATDFIDQTPEILPFKDNAARVSFALNVKGDEFNAGDMRTLIADISKGDRLSSTFRFESASFKLDTKAVRDIGRLAEALATDTYKGRKVVLVGFADNIGPYKTNQALSKKRAQAVEVALRAAGFKGGVVKGYGELAPVACNDTDADRGLNRRVEVWLK
jgi:phosphate transport system substrate-binding protein